MTDKGIKTSFQPKLVNGSIQTARTCTPVKMRASRVRKLCSSLLIMRGQRGDWICNERARPNATDKVSKPKAVNPPARATSHVTACQMLDISILPFSRVSCGLSARNPLPSTFHLPVPAVPRYYASVKTRFLFLSLAKMLLWPRPLPARSGPSPLLPTRGRFAQVVRCAGLAGDAAPDFLASNDAGLSLK